jgi:hypothetical protein
MPAKRAHGMDQEFYPWSPIVTRPITGTGRCGKPDPAAARFLRSKRAPGQR